MFALFKDICLEEPQMGWAKVISTETNELAGLDQIHYPKHGKRIGPPSNDRAKAAAVKQGQ
jgi:hypothetical protein